MEQKLEMDWTITSLIITVHGFGLLGILYFFSHFSWQTAVLTVVWFFTTGFSVTAGYHRLFTHQSYKAVRPIRLFFLCLGAASAQGSVMQWVSNHRRHHAADTNKEVYDPHSIKDGFWWAHFLWLFRKMPSIKSKYVKELAEDKLAVWQHKNYGKLVGIFGFALPALIATIFWGDLLGGLLLAGSLRTVLVWHMTWSVNSFAHKFGTKPFKRPDGSTNNWLASMFLIALGELFHENHHFSPRDYRNGWNWYDVDPTKWFIWTCSQIGLTWDLIRTPKEKILAAKAAAQ